MSVSVSSRPACCVSLSRKLLVVGLSVGDVTAGMVDQVTYANDLTSVHVSEGEIHCATNTLRTTPAKGWWKND